VIDCQHHLCALLVKQEPGPRQPPVPFEPDGLQLCGLNTSHGAGTWFIDFKVTRGLRHAACQAFIAHHIVALVLTSRSPCALSRQGSFAASQGKHGSSWPPGMLSVPSALVMLMCKRAALKAHHQRNVLPRSSSMHASWAILNPGLCRPARSTHRS